MLSWYDPEPFPPPFPPDHDPRENLHEVVSQGPDGSLQVISSKGQLFTVPPQDIPAGIQRVPGERVLGWVTPAAKPGVLGKLFGKKDSATDHLRIEPLAPDPRELSYAQAWLSSLRAAGLRVEGVPVEELLKERLRKIPFGSLGTTALEPLRKVLRGVFESLVGRFPSERSGDVDALAQLKQLLAGLGVNAFEPTPAKKSQQVWDRWVALADEANQALQAAGTPLRLIACEREVFPSQLGGDRDYSAPYPVWLVLSPSTVPALEAANILRRYRGAAFPLADAKKEDPRTLRWPDAAQGSPSGAVVSLRGEATEPAASTKAARFELDPHNLGPPKTPCRAVVRGFVPMDATGELITEDGLSVRFGRSACKDFEPQVGLEVWLIEAGPSPFGKGFRAQVVNLTGKKEGDRLSDLAAEQQLKGARRERERALLQRCGLKESNWFYWRQLVGLSASQRSALAAELVALKRESHLFDRLVEDLATVSPESFHPFLGELDWRTEPESLAWVGAPFDKVSFAVEALESATALQLLERVPVGTVGPAHELARQTRAPANDVGAAVLALARSGQPQAVAAIERWIARAKMDPAELASILVLAGWTARDGKLHRLWGDKGAQRLRRSATGKVELFTSAEETCAACRKPLLRLAPGAPATPLPFALYTCPRCNPFDLDPYFVEVSASGTPKTLLVEEVDEGFQPSAPLKKQIEPVKVGLEAAPQAVPDDLHEFDDMARIGGAPSWVQGASTPGPCPKCEGPMTFAAQLPDPPGHLWSGDTGMLYAFTCEPCRISATLIQNV